MVVTRNLRGGRRDLKKINLNDTVMECEMGSNYFPIIFYCGHE
jgi:hypothetical protein